MSVPIDLHWNIDGIVADLHALREKSLQNRRRHDRPPRLPARKTLAAIVDGLYAALFPNRLGLPDVSNGGIDYFVGHTIDVALRELYEQVLLELRFASSKEEARQRELAFDITSDFAACLPAVRALLETDIEAAYHGDPAARSVDEVLVCYPGVMAVIHHRLAHELHLLGVPLIARMIAEIAHSITGVDIHPGAEIGASFFIDHGTGVVVGETTVIGRNVRLYHGVTLGARRFPVDENGSLTRGGARHPIVEDDVVIYAGATILGRVTIGRGSSIGGNVWLTRSVPAGSQITQAQVRSESIKAGAGV